MRERITPPKVLIRAGPSAGSSRVEDKGGRTSRQSDRAWRFATSANGHRVRLTPALLRGTLLQWSFCERMRRNLAFQRSTADTQAPVPEGEILHFVQDDKLRPSMP